MFTGVIFEKLFACDIMLSFFPLLLITLKSQIYLQVTKRDGTLHNLELKLLQVEDELRKVKNEVCFIN